MKFSKISHFCGFSENEYVKILHYLNLLRFDALCIMKLRLNPASGVLRLTNVGTFLTEFQRDSSSVAVLMKSGVRLLGLGAAYRGE